MKNKLILIRGIPGSGKSTFARKNFPNILHLENDMFHYHNGEYEWEAENQKDAMAWCVETTDNALHLGMDVVVSNTFTKIKYIEHYKMIANLYGADFVVYRMDTKYKNIHGLNEGMVSNFKKSMQDYPGEIIITGEENDNSNVCNS